MEVAEVVQKFQALLQRIELQVLEKKAQVAHASVQWEACFQLVEQFKSSLNEAGEDYSVFAGDEEVEAAMKQVGIGPVLKMYYSNVKKLHAFAAAKMVLEGDLEDASNALTAASTRLVALQAYYEELSTGKDALLMRPLPSCNTDDVLVPCNAQPVLPPLLQCSICSDGFPF